MKKALDCSRIHLITRAYEDMELLGSRWSVESHTFFAAWGEFGSTFEDILNLMALPPHEEVNAMAVRIEGDDEVSYSY